jgi:hypothetical protein
MNCRNALRSQLRAAPFICVPGATNSRVTREDWCPSIYSTPISRRTPTGIFLLSTQRMLLQYVLKLIFLSVTQFLAITTINKIPKAADGLP